MQLKEVGQSGDGQEPEKSDQKSVNDLVYDAVGLQLVTVGIARRGRKRFREKQNVPYHEA